MLSVVGKIYAVILVDGVRKVTQGLIDKQQGEYGAGSGCVDQIFTLKQVGEKARENKRRVYVGFMDLEKEYDRVNREALWHAIGASYQKKISQVKSLRNTSSLKSQEEFYMPLIFL